MNLLIAAPFLYIMLLCCRIFLWHLFLIFGKLILRHTRNYQSQKRNHEMLSTIYTEFSKDRSEELILKEFQTQHHRKASFKELPELFHHPEAIPLFLPRKFHAAKSAEYHLYYEEQDFMDEDTFVKALRHPRYFKDSFHANAFIDLILVIDGGCHVHFPDSELVLTSDALCIITPDMPYMVQADDDANILHIIYKYEDFRIGLSTMISSSNILLSFLTKALYNAKEATYIAYFTSYAEEALFTIHALLWENHKQRADYQNVMYYLLSTIFTLTERERIGPFLMPPGQKYNLQQYETIYAYLNDNYASTTVQEIADHFHLSYTYLSKLFKKHTNQTVSEILQKIRLQSACGYLNHSTLSVQEISEMVGYNDVTHFIRLFKKAYGHTPLQYRKLKPID